MEMPNLANDFSAQIALKPGVLKIIESIALKAAQLGSLRKIKSSEHHQKVANSQSLQNKMMNRALSSHQVLAIATHTS
jgi:hypothetical protein